MSGREKRPVLLENVLNQPKIHSRKGKEVERHKKGGRKSTKKGYIAIEEKKDGDWERTDKLTTTVETIKKRGDLRKRNKVEEDS